VSASAPERAARVDRLPHAGKECIVRPDAQHRVGGGGANQRHAGQATTARNNFNFGLSVQSQTDLIAFVNSL